MTKCETRLCFSTVKFRVFDCIDLFSLLPLIILSRQTLCFALLVVVVVCLERSDFEREEGRKKKRSVQTRREVGVCLSSLRERFFTLSP